VRHKQWLNHLKLDPATLKFKRKMKVLAFTLNYNALHHDRLSLRWYGLYLACLPDLPIISDAIY
jgi:hypothetical protein